MLSFKGFFEFWAVAGKFLKDLVFPAECLGCGADGGFLCEGCAAKIPVNTCKCGLFRWIKRDDGPLDGIISVCKFEKRSLIQRCIHCYKYDFMAELGGPLGALMARALGVVSENGLIPSLSGHAYLCPVPLHPKRKRWRGFNQSELLAKEVACRSGLPFFPLLMRIRYKKPQMELTREERLINVKGAFRVADWCLPGEGKFLGTAIPRTVILVDDVATTLSTLNDCAAALKAAGTRRVYGLVLARVE